MELKELTALMRQTVDALENSSPVDIETLVQPLREAGITPNVHVGKGDQMDESYEGRKMMVEWYAGSLLDCVDKGAWFAINSIINCKDKFAPEAFLVD